MHVRRNLSVRWDESVRDGILDMLFNHGGHCRRKRSGNMAGNIRAKEKTFDFNGECLKLIDPVSAQHT